MNGIATRVLDGRAAAKAIREEVAQGCRRLRESRGIVPGLTVVLVGDDPASAVYVRNKEKAAREAGMSSRILRLPADCGEAAILDAVRGLNRDPHVHGILVQLPLPAGVRESHVLQAIDPDKDVDGFHPINAGRLMIGLPGFVPCTPAGIVELLKRNGIPLEGRRAAVVGRSNIVGKPMAILLLREHCTVTVCHSRTPDLAAVTSEADILVAALGKLAAIRAAHIREGAVVVDVGMNTVTDEATCRDLWGDDEKRLREIRERGATLAGDVHPREASGRAGWLSPVPGGVGPLTIAMLLKNTLGAASLAAAREDF